MRTYHPPSFEPPVWTRLGGHFQTIFGSIFPVPNIKYDKRRRFCTHDGDFFDVDIVLGHNKLNPYVVVCHGLESSAYSSHTLRIVERFVALGWNVFAINYRGCSGVPNRTLRTYHVGFTEDVDLLTKTIYEETEGSCTIYLAGFSLGGNIIIKFLGATVACVPLNPFYCQPKADRGISKVIYENLMTIIYLKYLVLMERKIIIGRMENDPIVDTEHLPHPQLFESLPIHFLYTENGGHCGYFSGFFVPSYMAQAMSHFFLSFVNTFAKE
ncbi:Putative esterase YheT [Galdieria sulphuraria]|nr:Putative esterase YheT [Galdieria sulphuraria]